MKQESTLCESRAVVQEIALTSFVKMKNAIYICEETQYIWIFGACDTMTGKASNTTLFQSRNLTEPSSPLETEVKVIIYA